MHKYQGPTKRPGGLARAHSSGAPGVGSRRVSIGGRKLPWAALVAAVVAVGGAGPATSAYALGAPSSPASGRTLVADAPGLTGFSPMSVTYVSTSEGWALGLVACGTSRCLRLLHTTNRDASWSLLPVPPVGPQGPDGPQLKVRFADSDDGWIFPTEPGEGPAMAWSTHSGGEHWTAIHFPGTTSPSGPPGVEDIEAAAGVVNAAVQVGDQVEVFSSPVSSNDWKRTGGPFELGAGPVPSGQLALQGNSGWFVENDRVVVSGGREKPSGKWAGWTPPCSRSGGPDLLAAATAYRLVAICTEGVWTGKKVTIDLVTSTNGGASFGPSHLLPFTSTDQADVTAATGTSTVAIGATVNHANTVDDALEMSFNGGTSWHSVYSHVGAGWLELGFTTVDQGVAIALANSGPNIMLATSDGGRHWAPVSF